MSSKKNLSTKRQFYLFAGKMFADPHAGITLLLFGFLKALIIENEAWIVNKSFIIHIYIKVKKNIHVRVYY